MSFIRQLKAFTKKHIIAQRRNKVGTFLEFFVPFLLMILTNLAYVWDFEKSGFWATFIVSYGAHLIFILIAQYSSVRRILMEMISEKESRIKDTFRFNNMKTSSYALSYITQAIPYLIFIQICYIFLVSSPKIIIECPDLYIMLWFSNILFAIGIRFFAMAIAALFSDFKLAS